MTAGAPRPRSGIMRGMPTIHRLFLALGLAVLVCAPASAEVTRLEIVRREVVLNGKAFGAVGPYEKLVGTVHFALDPALPANAGIVDLTLAPRNPRGLVEFSADFYLLKPVDPAKGNGRLFYEAGNRGTKRILPVFQRATGSADPSTAAEYGNGALMEQGYTLLWMGWQWDVPEGRMRMQIPIATDQGRPIFGLVRGNFIPGAKAASARIADRGHQPYPAINPNSGDHVMYVRTLPSDSPKVVARGRWRFTAPDTVTLDGGFEAGRIYDVVYMARDPRVIGVGLAGTRDLISFFKHGTTAGGNPSPGIRFAIGWGVSQTGRFLRHFVYEGFNADEQGRIVFDGVFDQVGGAGRGSFNHRFGQQSRDQLQHFNIQYPVDMFPFTDEEQTRSGHGRPGRAARESAPQQHRAQVLPPADELRVLQPRRLAGAHRRIGHSGRGAARHEPHLPDRVGAAHRGPVSSRALHGPGLRGSGRHEPARLQRRRSGVVQGTRGLGRGRHGAAGQAGIPGWTSRPCGARQGRLAEGAGGDRCRRRR